MILNTERLIQSRKKILNVDSSSAACFIVNLRCEIFYSRKVVKLSLFRPRVIIELVGDAYPPAIVIIRKRKQYASDGANKIRA